MCLVGLYLLLLQLLYLFTRNIVIVLVLNFLYPPLIGLNYLLLSCICIYVGAFTPNQIRVDISLNCQLSIENETEIILEVSRLAGTKLFGPRVHP